MPTTDAERGWLLPSAALVAAITAFRLVLMAFNRTDLFVDESQYWLWGQDFAFGYFSKPPLIAWVIGASTTLAGSDAPFWVRAPGAIFHAATALVLAALSARLFGRRQAVWVAVSYATLPMASLGSLLISTDTIMAPFFAAALLCHFRLVETSRMRFALLAGAFAGLAFLAKYAGVYFLLGVALGAVLLPSMRISRRHGLAMLGAFCVMIAPNILWNFGHGFATLTHTMDNVGWVQPDDPASPLNPAGMAEFFLSQFAVFGPVLFAALVWAAFRPATPSDWRLLVFAVPAILIVSVQALLDQAYANWAASAYFAGTIVAVATLIHRPRWLVASLAINTTIAVLLPVLTLLPDLTLGRDKPVIARYLGQGALSRQLLAEAERAGNIPVVTSRRDVLADLFYTGRGSGIAFYAPRPKGRPENHYAQTHALPEGMTGDVLFVTEVPPVCPERPQPSALVLKTDGGAYDGLALTAYVIPAACVDASD